VKLARMDERFGLVADDRFVDLQSAGLGTFDVTSNAIFEAWDELRAAAGSLDPGLLQSSSVPLDHQRLGPPVGYPRQIFALALNYADHSAEAGISPPEYPLVFAKYPSCLTGPGNPIELGSNRVDWEVELVVVIGRGGLAIAEDDGWAAVAGLTVGQDLTDRRVQFRKPMPHFSMAKSGPTYGPLGPVLVSTDEFDDADDLSISCEINGEVVQDSRTSQLVFSVPRLVAEISSTVRLLPGDAIFTGTPAGVGSSRDPRRYLAPGDQIVSVIEGIGSMHNVCRERH
jgi:2,4-didehydro-3-deoxy-L-rhamnonate hydrolase